MLGPSWNFRSTEGKALGPGIYFARTEGGRQEWSGFDRRGILAMESWISPPGATVRVREAAGGEEVDPMIQLDLSPEESAILVAVLESYLSDLRMEIANTDRMEFRDSLKERKAVILKAVAALESSSGTARPRK